MIFYTKASHAGVSSAGRPRSGGAGAVPRAQADRRCAIVLCHPRSDSFCAKVAEQAESAAKDAGFSTIVRDLYGMAFDPVAKARDLALNDAGGRPAADVEQEVLLLNHPQVVVLVYPIWFGSPPAMLKGYVERVLGAGFAGPGTVAIAAGPRPRLLLTIAVSGARLAWIERKGIAASAGRVFGEYLASALVIPRAEHLAIDNVVPAMPQARGVTMLAKIRRDVQAILAGLDRAAAPAAAETVRVATVKRWDTLPHPAG
jgi:NAD(P)H dehydrogenase (quinone)